MSILTPSPLAKGWNSTTTPHFSGIRRKNKPENPPAAEQPQPSVADKIPVKKHKPFSWYKYALFLGLGSVLGGFFGSAASDIVNRNTGIYEFETECSPIDKSDTSIRSSDSSELIPPFPIEFKFFKKNAAGQCREVKPDEAYIQKQQMIIEQLNILLQNRPDLIEAFKSLEHPVEIMMFDTDYLFNVSSGKVASGSAYRNQIALTAGNIDWGSSYQYIDKETGEKLHYETFVMVPHEFIHVLDFLLMPENSKEKDNQATFAAITDALLPGWEGTEQEKAFDQAVVLEFEKLKAGNSILKDYAFKNSSEFVASLIEIYLLEGKAFAESSPELYTLVNDYFKLDTATEDIWPNIQKGVIEISSDPAKQTDGYQESDYQPPSTPDYKKTDYRLVYTNPYKPIKAPIRVLFSFGTPLAYCLIYIRRDKKEQVEIAETRTS